MTTMVILLIIYISIVILGYWRVDGRRAPKKPSYYDYDDESDMFEKMTDQEYEVQSNSHKGKNVDPMDEVLDTSDLDMHLDYRMYKNMARSQRKSPQKSPDSWAMLVKEGKDEMQLGKMKRGGHFGADCQMIDEGDEEQH
ncbi:uncharacterized protein LOC27209128 [Drosophila simulans]|uniref:uncharacterized protein LOC27209128 n=1 Tax=Drosophila simulans TaxID=7240 RepID=UPI00078AE0BB|nr:uncharacterized protein LOC27209128 [Drosophila simulans]KMZ10276.1 uncharacterized protein Dsimw501_GD29285 [Drosophila simulans]